MIIKSNGYDRNLHALAMQLLRQFPILVIIGARQVGKTYFSKRLAPNFLYLDLENPNDFDRINHDPVFFLNNLQNLSSSTTPPR